MAFQVLICNRFFFERRRFGPARQCDGLPEIFLEVCWDPGVGVCCHRDLRHYCRNFDTGIFSISRITINLMFRPFLHIALHIVVPGVVARWAYAERWKIAWFIMLLVNIIDFDHLLADPIYDPNRCGIGFHPLHSYLAITAYLGLTVIAKTRLVGLGLVIHMALDWLDCLWMSLE
jgi:hypothetical protein